MPPCRRISLPLSLLRAGERSAAFPVRHRRRREGGGAAVLFSGSPPAASARQKRARPLPPPPSIPRCDIFPRRYIYPRFVSVYARSGEGRAASDLRGARRRFARFLRAAEKRSRRRGGLWFRWKPESARKPQTSDVPRL